MILTICLHCLLRYIHSSGAEIHIFGEISTYEPFKYIMDKPILIPFVYMEKSTRVQSVKPYCCFATTVKPVLSGHSKYTKQRSL